MKQLLLIVLILIFGVGGYFGFKEIRRKQILDSGRPVLLIDEKAGYYTWSDMMRRDDIDRSLKIKGYYDELTQSEIDALTAGLNFVQGANLDPGDPRSISVDPGVAPVPSDEQLPGWQALVSGLSQGQVDACANLGLSDLEQYCLVRHHVLRLLNSNASSAECDLIFMESYKTECIADVENSRTNRVPDLNGNGIIDEYEQTLDDETAQQLEAQFRSSN